MPRPMMYPLHSFSSMAWREIKTRTPDCFGIRSVKGYYWLMPKLERITIDPAVMGGKPCIRGLRVTVGTIVGFLSAGKTREEILRLYPYLEAPDIDEALAYATWRVEEQEVAVGT